MQACRGFAGGVLAAAVAWLAASGPWAAAQSAAEPQRDGCLSFHELHPEMPTHKSSEACRPASRSRCPGLHDIPKGSSPALTNRKTPAAKPAGLPYLAGCTAVDAIP